VKGSQKVVPTPSPGGGKEGRKTSRPAISARRPTAAPPTVLTTTPIGLTILLAPPPQPSFTSHLFPAIFKQYHKVQQLVTYEKVEVPPRPSKKGLEQTDLRKEAGKLNIAVLQFFSFCSISRLDRLWNAHLISVSSMFHMDASIPSLSLFSSFLFFRALCSIYFWQLMGMIKIDACKGLSTACRYLHVFCCCFFVRHVISSINCL
jgi:hypothetical protein